MDDSLPSPVGAPAPLRPCMDPLWSAGSTALVSARVQCGVVAEEAWEVQQEQPLFTGEILCDRPPVSVEELGDGVGFCSGGHAGDNDTDHDGGAELGDAVDVGHSCVEEALSHGDNGDWSPIALSRFRVEAMTVLSFVQVERSGRLRHPLSGWTRVDADLDAQLPAIREFAREACFPHGLVTEMAWDSQQDSSCGGDAQHSLPSPVGVATCERAHSVVCPHVRVKCSGCGTVVPSYEAVRGSCCDFGFRDFSYMSPVDDSNRDVCWCVPDDESCQDEEPELAPEYIAFGSLVFPRLSSDRMVGEDAGIRQDAAPVGSDSGNQLGGLVCRSERSLPFVGARCMGGDQGVVLEGDVIRGDKMEDSSCSQARDVPSGGRTAGDCYLSSICRSRASFAAAERWFMKEQLAAGSFQQDADRSKFYRSVDAFERGAIDKDRYETLVVSALSLRRWLGFVDQISVVHAGKIEREIGVGASVEKWLVSCLDCPHRTLEVIV